MRWTRRSGRRLPSIPADRRKIITTHDAFGYFGAAYGMQFIAPEGVSTDVEPSAKDVAKIIAQIKRQKIPAVFLENVSDPRMMEEIARETGAKIGGKLYSDALSAPNGPAGTYIDDDASQRRRIQRRAEKLSRAQAVSPALIFTPPANVEKATQLAPIGKNGGRAGLMHWFRSKIRSCAAGAVCAGVSDGRFVRPYASRRSRAAAAAGTDQRTLHPSRRLRASRPTISRHRTIIVRSAPACAHRDGVAVAAAGSVDAGTDPPRLAALKCRRKVFPTQVALSFHARAPPDA